MVFVTVGSQKFQFDRLLKKVDQLVETGVISEPVFMQSGCCAYQPLHCAAKAFLDRDEFAQKLDQADLIITHAGAGTIVGSMKRGKKIIAVPRRKQYGEHVDDHQLQILRQFEQTGQICVCYEVGELEQALERVEQLESVAYVSNGGRIIEDIESYLETALQKR